MKDSASMGNLFAHEHKETSAWKEYVWQLLLCPLKKRNKDIVKTPMCIKTKREFGGSYEIGK